MKVSDLTCLLCCTVEGTKASLFSCPPAVSVHSLLLAFNSISACIWFLSLMLTTGCLRCLICGLHGFLINKLMHVCVFSVLLCCQFADVVCSRTYADYCLFLLSMSCRALSQVYRVRGSFQAGGKLIPADVYLSY